MLVEAMVLTSQACAACGRIACVRSIARPPSRCHRSARSTVTRRDRAAIDGMPRLVILGLLAACCWCDRYPAQIGGNGSNGPLAPFAVETLLDTTANGGVFQFTSVNIRAGTTVRFVGPNPAIVL